MKSDPVAATTTPTQSAADKSRGGRPSIYSRELAQRICQTLGSSSKSLRTICLDPDMPARATIYKWLQEIPEFREDYTRAREEQLEFLAEEMIQIAEDASNDWMQTEKGLVPNPQAIARSKIRIAVRQWLISHLIPKKYGRPVAKNEPVVRRPMTAEEFEERMKLAEVNAR